MTAAERKRLERDRRKAGLVRIEVWVHAENADAVLAAIKAVDAPRDGASDI